MHFTISKGNYQFNASGSLQAADHANASYSGPNGLILSGSINESLILSPGSYSISIISNAYFDATYYQDMTAAGSGSSNVSLNVTMTRVQ